jgi:hypothetical protein
MLVFVSAEREQEAGVKIPLHPHALWKRRTDVENPKILCHLCEIDVRGTRGRHKFMYISSKEPEYMVCDKCVYSFQRPIDLGGRPTRLGNPFFQYKPPPFVPASDRINKKIDEMLNKAQEEDNTPKKKRKKKDAQLEPTKEELESTRAKLEESGEARRKKIEAMLQAPGEEEKKAAEEAAAAKAAKSNINPPSPLRGAMGQWGALRSAVVQKKQKRGRGGAKLEKVVQMAHMWRKLFHITRLMPGHRKKGAKGAADSEKVVPTEDDALEAALAEDDEDGREVATDTIEADLAVEELS